jgi:hypothetical protein
MIAVGFFLKALVTDVDKALVCSNLRCVNQNFLAASTIARIAIISHARSLRLQAGLKSKSYRVGRHCFHCGLA